MSIGRTNHTQFAASPASDGVTAKEKRVCYSGFLQVVGGPQPQRLQWDDDKPTVYGIPAKPKDGPARVVLDDQYAMLVIHGVLVSKNYRRPYHVKKYEALRDEINAAAKRGAA